MHDRGDDAVVVVKVVVVVVVIVGACIGRTPIGSLFHNKRQTDRQTDRPF